MQSNNVFLDFIRAKGLTQTQLAQMAGVKQPSVWEWIHGNSRPSIQSAIRLAKAGGPPLHEIYPELHSLSSEDNTNVQ